MQVVAVTVHCPWLAVIRHSSVVAVATKKIIGLTMMAPLVHSELHFFILLLESSDSIFLLVHWGGFGEGVVA
jgi:hypothetical protein